MQLRPVIFFFFCREPGEDLDLTGFVTEGCFFLSNDHQPP